MGQQKEREKMNILIKILKNIGVIVLAIALFVVGSIPGNLLVSVFTNEYLQLIIPSIVSILVTFGLVWFVSGKLLKIDAEELGIKLKKVDFKWIVISVALPTLILLFYAFVLPSKPYVSGDEGLAKSLLRGFFEAGITAGLGFSRNDFPLYEKNTWGKGCSDRSCCFICKYAYFKHADF